MEQALITEVLVRDGLQIEKAQVPTKEKVHLVRALMDAGLASLEVGAFVNRNSVPQMADSDEVVAELQGSNAALHALVFNRTGADRAVAAGARHVRLVLSASDGHSRSNAGVSTADALARLEAAAGILLDANIHVEAVIATAFVCPFDGETPPTRAVAISRSLTRLGVEVIHLADTIGAASPLHIRRTITAVQDALPDQQIGLHLHNTYGMAGANVWEALALGIRRFDSSLGGVGGCPFAPGASGNLATDDLVNLLHHSGIATGIDVTKLTLVRDEVRSLLGHRLDSALSAIPAAPAELASTY